MYVNFFRSQEKVKGGNYLNHPALTLSEGNNLDKISKLFPKVLLDPKPQSSTQLVLGYISSDPFELCAFFNKVTFKPFIIHLNEPTDKILRRLINDILGCIQLLLMTDVHFAHIKNIMFFYKPVV